MTDDVAAGTAPESDRQVTSPIWLTVSGMDQFPVRGELALVDGRIRLTVAGAARRKSVQWLEEASGETGLDQRLQRGELVTVLDLPRDQASVKFTNMFVSPGIRLRTGDTLWRIWFMPPSGPTNLFRIGKAAAIRRRWREALNP
jgi:hypothetical protein